MDIQTKVLFSMIMALALLWSSCADPITEEIIAAAEDRFKPIITITTPLNNDTYYSEIDVRGTLEDHAISNDDGRGKINEMSVYIGRSAQYRGGIVVNTKNEVQQDKEKGEIDISFNAVSGEFQFKVDTSDLSNTIVVEITASDLNGNETTAFLDLRESSGPAVNFEEIDRFFSEGNLISLEASITDSSQAQHSIQEIVSVTLEIDILGWSKTLDIGSTTPNELGMYEIETPFFNGAGTGNSSSAKIILDGTAFRYDFYPPDSGMRDNTKIVLTAKDKNGKKNSANITLIPSTGAPFVNIKNPNVPLLYYYHQDSELSSLGHMIDFDMNVRNSRSLVDKIFLRMIQSESEVRLDEFEVLTSSEDYPTDGIFNQNIDFSGFNGTIKVEIEAISLNKESTRVYRTMKQDVNGPSFDDFVFRNSNPSTPAMMGYAVAGDTATLTFSLTDDASGVAKSTLTLLINESTDEINLQESSNLFYNNDFSFPSTAEDPPSYNLAPIPFKLEVSDNIGRKTILSTEQKDSLIYYHAPATEAPEVSLSTDTSTNFLKAGDVLNVSIDTGLRHLDHENSDFTLYFGGSQFGESITIDESVPLSALSVFSYEIEEEDTDGPLEYGLLSKDRGGYDFPEISKTESDYSVDTTAPTITHKSLIIPITANESKNIAKVGDKVQEKFTVEDGGSGPSFSTPPEVKFIVVQNDNRNEILVAATEDSSVPNGWIATYSVTEESPEGSVTVEIKAQDRARNKGILEENETGISIDRTAPIIKVTTFESSNIFDTSIIGGTSEIILEFEIKDSSPLKDPVIKIIDANDTEENFSVTEGLKNGDSISYSGRHSTNLVDGTITYSISSSDMGGNEASTEEEGDLTKDTTAPTITHKSLIIPITANESKNIAKVGDKVQEKFTVEDGGSGPSFSTPPEVKFIVVQNDNRNEILVAATEDSSVPNGWIATYSVTEESPEGSVTVEIKAQDRARNKEILEENETGISIDRTAPIIKVTTFESSNIFDTSIIGGTSEIILEFEIKDSSPLKDPVIKIIDANDTEENFSVTEGLKNGDSISYSGRHSTNLVDGTITYSISSSDMGGNEASTEEEGDLTKDTTAPTITHKSLIIPITANESKNIAKVGDKVQEKFTVEDGGSGPSFSTPPEVKFIVVQNDNRNEILVAATEDSSVPNGWIATYSVTEESPEGSVTVEIKAQDRARNKEILEENETGISIDRTAPIIKVISVVDADAENPDTEYTVTIEVSDLHLDPSTIRINSAQATVKNLNQWEATIDATLNDIITATATDKAGNQKEIEISIEVTL